VLVLAGTYFIDFFGVANYGLSFGYFGKLNQIKSRIESCNGITIDNIRIHYDLSLEDFWITVSDESGTNTELEFLHSNIKTVSELSLPINKLGCSYSFLII